MLFMMNAVSKNISKYIAVILYSLSVLQITDLSASNEDGEKIAEIRTVLLHQLNNPLSNPVIELKGTEQLILKFDVLSEEIQNYEYNILACNADWSSSIMFPAEYIDGFQINAVNDYRISSSFNNIRYVHYFIVFPNQQMQLKKSGNYIINVFKSGYPDSVILTKRFMVYEQLVDAGMYSQRPLFSQYQDTHQELRFDVDLKNYEVHNALSEIKITIMQNFRWDNAKHNITPVFVNENYLQFRRDGRYVFNAGKEFRYFDIRNLLVRNERLKAIKENNRDTVYLYTDVPRNNEGYRFMSDMNGRFVIGSYPWTSADYDASYVYVLFHLQTNAFYRNGNIYITGKFADWKLLPENKMNYDAETKSYKSVVLLKQGLYNYVYAYSTDNNEEANIAAMEGDYFETENEYQMFVYHCPAGNRYNRLIAYKAVDTFGNSRK
jgi:hypothetical protein